MKVFGRIQLLLNVVLMLCCNTAFSDEIKAIKSTDTSLSKSAKVEFPPNTLLAIPGSPLGNIYVTTYDGSWLNGLAHGKGTLQGYVLIPTVNNPIYIQLHSKDTIERTEAEEIVKRVRQDAIFMHQDPDIAVNNFLGEKKIPIELESEFSSGIAQGEGTLRSGYRTLKGQFSDWLPDGPMTLFVDGIEVLTENYKKGIAQAGPIRIQLYTAANRVSRIFVGRSENEKLIGEWIDIPWQDEFETGSYYGYGGSVGSVYKDGHQLACKLKAVTPPATVNELLNIKGDLEFSGRLTDPVYLEREKKCQLVNPEGWKFNYGITGGPFDTKFIPPFDCVDPQNRSGVMSINQDNMFNCNVTIVTTEIKYKWLTKIGKNIEREARNANDRFFNFINPIGKAIFVDTLCGIAQKDEAHCNISVSVSTTIATPDDANSKKATEKIIDKGEAARQRIKENTYPHSKDGFWETAAIIYDECSRSCTGAFKNYSLMRIDEIEKLLKSDFDEQAKSQRFASYLNDSLSLVEKIKSIFSNVEVANHIMIYAALDSNITAARNQLDKLERTPRNSIYIDIGYDRLNTIALKHLSLAALEIGVDAVKLYPSVIFPSIPKVNLNQQTFLLLKEGINVEKFYEKYKDVNDADKFIKHLIEEKFKDIEKNLYPKPTLNDLG